MEKFAAFGYARYQLRQLNQCRVFLRVTSISDLCNGNGDAIMRHFTITQPYNPLASYSSLKWPEHGQPSESAWTLWRHALCKCLSCNTQYILRQPLGHWISTDSSWGSFFHRPTNNLFVLSECRWHRFGLNTETFCGPTSKYVLLDHDLPPFWTSHVAVTWIEGNELITHGI